MPRGSHCPSFDGVPLLARLEPWKGNCQECGKNSLDVSGLCFGRFIRRTRMQSDFTLPSAKRQFDLKITFYSCILILAICRMGFATNIELEEKAVISELHSVSVWNYVYLYLYFVCVSGSVFLA